MVSSFLTRLSIRARIAIAATAAVALVLIAGGVATVASFADRERSSLDRELERRGQGPALRVVRPGPPGPGPFEERPIGDPGPDGLLAESGSFVRVINGGEVVRAAGDVPTRGLPADPDPGFATVEAGGRRWRTLTIEVMQPRGVFADAGTALLQFGADAEPMEDRIDSMERRVALISAFGIGVAALLAGMLAGPALAPLSRLRRAVAGVTTTRDLSRRLPVGDVGREVDDLAHGVNEMLARLEHSAAETERALEATRRFAADVGHEVRTPLTSMRANLDAVRRNPSMPEEQRLAILNEAAREQEELVAVLDALQALARGDSAAALPREPVDMAELLDAAVLAARRRHPQAQIHLTAAEGEHAVTGWPEGLRLLVDNLIENAVRHGGRHVEVGLARDHGMLELTVEDDGPGIPVAERQRIFARFTRGARAVAPGSGLGLALVAQQAQLHGGSVEVGDSEAGGARFRVNLPDAR